MLTLAQTAWALACVLATTALALQAVRMGRQLRTELHAYDASEVPVQGLVGRPVVWMTGLLAVCALSLYARLPEGAVHAQGLLLLSGACIVAAAFSDLDERFIPDPISYLALWLALLAASVGGPVTPADAIQAAAVGYGMFWLAHVTSRRGVQEGMGLGDAKLIAAVGAASGMQHMVTVLVLLGLCACAHHLWRAWRKDLTQMPLGPSIVAAYLGAPWAEGVLGWP